MQRLTILLCATAFLAVACSRTPGNVDVLAPVPSLSKSPATAAPATPPAVSLPKPKPSPVVAAGSAAPRIRAGKPATIAVNVATVWGSASAPRSVDKPAMENPARYRTWLGAMTTSQRRALGPTRVNTSVLFDEGVIVTSVSGSWAHVVVPSQKSPWDARGYPGWIPVRQLSPSLPPANAKLATVIAKTTKAKLSEGGTVELSYATRLPVLRSAADSVEVWGPGGSLSVAAGDVVVHAASGPAQPRTAASIIADARRFLGLPYLWDGSSAFGFDCSGITYQVFRTHGVLLPRDSFGQVTAGRSVSRANMQPGDLAFFATNGKVHHVGIYIGDGKMLHAPRTGRSVEIISLSEPAYDSEFFAARRLV